MAGREVSKWVDVAERECGKGDWMRKIVNLHHNINEVDFGRLMPHQRIYYTCFETKEEKKAIPNKVKR